MTAGVGVIVMAILSKWQTDGFLVGPGAGWLLVPPSHNYSPLVQAPATLRTGRALASVASRRAAQRGKTQFRGLQPSETRTSIIA